ncbi:hypothetical protein MMC25_007065 [Agyrium rufum]|nr:hypothetical protein [Agyrium rufum]
MESSSRRTSKNNHHTSTAGTAAHTASGAKNSSRVGQPHGQSTTATSSPKNPTSNSNVSKAAHVPSASTSKTHTEVYALTHSISDASVTDYHQLTRIGSSNRSNVDPLPTSPISPKSAKSPRIEISGDRLFEAVPAKVPLYEHGGKSSAARTDSEAARQLPQRNFAILGSEDVGKSTFVRRALDLKKPPSTPVPAKKMSLEGELFLVGLIEMHLDEFDLNDNGFQWPEKLGSTPIPKIDGVLVLYDVTESKSTGPVPRLLHVCSKNAIPCMLVGCKADQHSAVRLAHVGGMEQRYSVPMGIDSFVTSLEKSDSQKRCISFMLRNLRPDRPAVVQTHLGPVRPRALTTSHSTRTAEPISSASTSKHNRAMSEMSASYQRNSSRPPLQPASIGPPPSERPPQPRSCSSSKEPTSSARSPPSSLHSRLPSNGSDIQAELLSDSPRSGRSRRPMKIDLSHLKARPAFSPMSTPTTIANSFLDRTELAEEEDEMNMREQSIEDEDEDDDDDEDEDDDDDEVKTKPKAEEEEGSASDSDSSDSDSESEASAEEVQAQPKVTQAEPKSGGLTFEELVTMLLQEQITKANKKFVAIFLCLYRKFTAPKELLAAIIRRFEAAERDDNAQLIRVTAQLRYVSILARWLAEYPGDFAYPTTYQQVKDFTAKLAKIPLFAVAAKEMSTHLDSVVEDDDTNWACSDLSRMLDHPSGPIQLSPKPSLDPGVRPTPRHIKSASTSSTTPSVSVASSTAASTSSISYYRHIGTSMIPRPQVPLGKPDWHYFIDSPLDDIARELTLIDRTMFLSIRPRDLVRHVTLSAKEKAACRNLEYVNRMINHFNHVAFCVANVILFRDKAKHRAKALEKFMQLAWKLRYLNNYNGLGAVVAGINGTAVHRLYATKDLVASNVLKDFMRLEILMGTSKSSFAYRLAWENTPPDGRIPFLPLHRRDLVSVQAGNKTFCDEAEKRINWKKFEVMGDVVVGLQASQGCWGLGGSQADGPEALRRRDQGIERFFLEVGFAKDDEELHSRSLQVEPPSNHSQSGQPKKWYHRLRQQV